MVKSLQMKKLQKMEKNLQRKLNPMNRIKSKNSQLKMKSQRRPLLILMKVVLEVSIQLSRLQVVMKKIRSLLLKRVMILKTIEERLSNQKMKLNEIIIYR